MQRSGQRDRARRARVHASRPSTAGLWGGGHRQQPTATAGEKGADQVVLYTDVGNPTSDSISQSIGFVVDHEAEERRFVHERDGEAK